jgi:nicotinamidase-related amidase
MHIQRRALVVIDVQQEYITGELKVEYPPPTVSLSNIGRAMDAAASRSVPVVVVRHVSPEGSPVFGRGSRGCELHEVVASRPRALEFEKALPSALEATPLLGWLASHEINTLTLVGYTTNNCLDSTAKHALHAGLSVELLSDAAGTFSYTNKAGEATAEEIHRSFCVIVQSRFGAVATTDEWIGALDARQPLERDSPVESRRRAHLARREEA